MNASSRATTQRLPPETASSRFLSRLAFVALLCYGGTFLYLAVRHILYPGFTEPMEGSILQSIERVAHGLTPYPEPGAEFIALDYLPLYYLLAAPLYLIFGDSFVGPRLISTVCALFAGYLLGRIAWRESNSRTIALLAAALYFSGYRIMDAYLTCALPDSLLLVWLLLGYYFLAYSTKRRHDALWLICFSLAFWTKQQGAIYFGFALLYALFLRKRNEQRTGQPVQAIRHLPRAVIILGFLIGGPLAYLLVGQWLGARFFFFTWTLPARWDHQLLFSMRRTLFVLTCFVPFLSLLSGLYFRQAVSFRTRTLPPLAWFTVTALLSAAFTMISAGSSNNHYIPFIAALSVTAALGAHSLLQHGAPPAFALWITGTVILSTVVMALAMEEYGHQHGLSLIVPLASVLVLCGYFIIRAGKLAPHRHSVALAALLVLGQFAVAIYYPPAYLPQAGYVEGIARLRGEINKLDATLIWADYGNVPAALTAGKIGSAPSWIALEDIERQQNALAEVNRDLAPFRERIRRAPNLYIFSNAPLEEIPGWQQLAVEFVLIRDYDQTFSAVRQIVSHWYGSEGYPRFLYGKRAGLINSEGRAQAIR